LTWKDGKDEFPDSTFPSFELAIALAGSGEDEIRSNG
jgi:hypothetical protein